ncbi:HAD family phosphatase [Fusibacter sp. 3D3]|uniref:HAD family hydrolase n=1 Tax=Fusibacter sp. 3D3 TaxID=1048380 RepID=UPI000853218D|nr:HAD family phosphatase [Fusibacter sp. 3D3]GAU77533.1 HAD-superfamily hydrolase, subfamily IA, variant 3 protein family [Fusibacter sp. 3D3]
MNYFEDIEAIIFDLDGTLVDSMWIWKQIDIDFLEKRGYSLPEDLQKSIEGMSFTETAAYFIKRFNLAETPEALKLEWNEMANHFYAKEIKLKENVHLVIEYALRHNIKLGIGTSNSKELLQAVLEANGIRSAFNSIRTSCEVASGKPSPDIFLKVAEDLGVSPERCLVFEDTHAGILAGKSAGMKVVAIYDAVSEPYAEIIKEDADHYIFDYTEIMA